MTDIVVKVDDLEVRRASRTVLSGASFQVSRGEVIALMGASGSGKTTILRAIAGLDPFERGTVVVDDVVVERGPLRGTVMRRLRRKVGMVFQFHCLFEHLPVLENVCLAPVHAQGIAHRDAAARAHDLLRSLGVDHRAHAFPRELSGGEAQRVAIARALAVDPPVLLMDEPTASLDASRRAELAALVRSLATRTRTVVITTHDEAFARASTTRVLRVCDGIIRADE